MVFDSSEVWSGFRVARRAKAVLESADINSGEQVIVTAVHDGYRRLKGKVTHRRTIAMAAKQLIVSDQLTGDFKQAVAHFHLHPDVKANVGSDGSIQLQLTNGQLIEFRSTGLCQLVNTSWHPHFGQIGCYYENCGDSDKFRTTDHSHVVIGITL